jgi:hypothetical protein
MIPQNPNFTCQHQGLPETVEVEHYKTSYCDYSFDYKLCDEFYLPDHDCTFNFSDVVYSSTEKEFNAYTGKSLQDVDLYREPQQLKDEAAAFGKKITKIDNKLAQRICVLAQASKFVIEEKKSLAQTVGEVIVTTSKKRKI